MPRSPTAQQGTRHVAYKEITLPQLRAFCETVRLRSMTAAAHSLGIAHPTVWKQLHALQKQLGVALLETSTRGCRPTEAGRTLVQLGGGLVDDIDHLVERFRQTFAKQRFVVSVALPPRAVVEDVPQILSAVDRALPEVHLVFRETQADQVVRLVEAGEVDIGLTAQELTAANAANLVSEPCYELETVLVAPKDHALASRRTVRPTDICKYPLLNSPAAFPDPATSAILRKLGAFDNPARRFVLSHAQSIRQYARLGFGIGLIGAPLRAEPDRTLHERSMSRYFGRLAIAAVHRHSVLRGEELRSVIAALRNALGHMRRGSRKGKTNRRPAEGVAGSRG